MDDEPSPPKKVKTSAPGAMEKMGLGPDVDSPGLGSDGQVPLDRRHSVERCNSSLAHACRCKNTNCESRACARMKKVVSHTKSCKRKTNGGCPICKQLIALCLYHAKFCQEVKCQVPFCLNLKNKLKQQEKQHHQQQSLLMKRRKANKNAMTSNALSHGNPNTPAAPVSPIQPATPQQDQSSTPLPNHMDWGTPRSQQQFTFQNKSQQPIIYQLNQSRTMPSMTNQTQMNTGQMVGNAASNINYQQGVGVVVKGNLTSVDASGTMHRFAMVQREISMGNQPGIASEQNTSSAASNLVSSSSMQQQPQQLFGVPQSSAYASQGQVTGFAVNQTSNPQNSIAFSNTSDVNAMAGMSTSTTMPIASTATAFVNRKMSADASNLAQGDVGMMIKSESMDHSSWPFYGPKSPGKSSTITIKSEANADNRFTSDLQTSAVTSTSSTLVKVEPKTEPETPAITFSSSTPVKVEPKTEPETPAITFSRSTPVKVEPKTEPEAWMPSKPKPVVSTPRVPKPSKVFTASESREALLPVVEKLFKQEPDSHPFRFPVDADPTSMNNYLAF